MEIRDFSRALSLSLSLPEVSLSSIMEVNKDFLVEMIPITEKPFGTTLTKLMISINSLQRLTRPERLRLSTIMPSKRNGLMTNCTLSAEVQCSLLLQTKLTDKSTETSLTLASARAKLYAISSIQLTA